MHWSTGSIKILGIQINPDRKKMIQENFEIVLHKMAQVLTIWNSRNLTLTGRVLVVNTLVCSLATQKFICLPTPEESFFDSVKKMIRNFLWKNGRPKIAYNQLVQETHKGGLKLIDLKTKEQALKIKWVKLAMEPKEFFWKHAMRSLMPIPELYECNIKRDKAKEIFKVDTFWNSVLEAWSEINYHKPVQREEILGQVIWYNSHIQLEHTDKAFDKMRKKQILKIRDIYDEQDNKILSYNEVFNRYGDVGCYLTYYRLISSITKNGRLLSKDEDKMKNLRVTVHWNISTHS